MSHDDQGQTGASGRSVPVSSLVQRRQVADTESRGSSQRFPFPCNKTKTARTAGRMSSRSPPQRHEQKLCMRRAPFVRIRCTTCPPSKWATVGSLPTSVLVEEHRGHYKYSLATSVEGRELSLDQIHSHPHQNRPREVVLPLY